MPGRVAAGRAGARGASSPMWWPSSAGRRGGGVRRPSKSPQGSSPRRPRWGGGWAMMDCRRGDAKARNRVLQRRESLGLPSSTTRRSDGQPWARGDRGPRMDRVEARRCEAGQGAGWRGWRVKAGRLEAGLDKRRSRASKNECACVRACGVM